MAKQHSYEGFGRWLKALRQKLGLSQHELAQQMGYEVSLLRKIEAGSRRPSEKFKKQLAIVAHLPYEAIPTPGLLNPLPVVIPDAAHTVPLPGALFSGSYLPLPPNPLFTNRLELLRSLALTFSERNSTAVALTGIGGIGKTQLAVEFAHRYGRYFPGGVFWLNFADAQTMSAQIARCGRLEHLNLRPGFGQLSLEQQVCLVQQAWQEPLPRLLIFDNCESETAFAKWQPPHGGCRILLTSRRSWWNPALGLTQLPVDALSRPDSIWLLRRFVPTLTDDESAQIASTMADLPLALHLAGSYLARNSDTVTPQLYLSQMRQGQRLHHESLQTESYSPTTHESNVRQTISVNCQQLQTAVPIDRLAKWLLACMSHLSPAAPAPPEILQALLPKDTDPAQFNPALQRLLQLGLITATVNHSARLHPLVAEFVREWTKDWGAQTAVEEILITLTAQGNGQHSREPARNWQPHLFYVTTTALPRQDVHAAQLCLVLGQHLFFSSDYFKGARYYLETAVAIQEKIVGPEHLHTAVCLEWLGRTYISCQEFERGRTCFERVLSIRQQQLPSQDVQLATTHTHLGILLFTMGELGSAHAHLEKAHHIYLQTLGPEHADTGFNHHCLGLNFFLQGKYELAESHSTEAMRIAQQIYGLMHSDTARAANALGLIHQRQGELKSAQQLFEYAYTTRLQLLGEEQSETVTSLNNLGSVYRELGDLAQAANLLHTAAAKWEGVFGPESGYAAIALNNLGLVYHDQGDYATSQTYLERAYHNRQQIYGEQHFYTADTLHNLGTLAQTQKNLPLAREYYGRAWHIRSQIFDPDHPLVWQSQQAFAALDGHV